MIGALLRWIGYTVVLAFAGRLLYLAWLDGMLSTWSFWILGATTAFEVGVLVYIMAGVNDWHEAHRRGETFEARMAANRAPKKRFGNAPPRVL